MMDRNVVGTVVVVLALSIAGCGGSGSLSRADLAKQASAICKQRTTNVALLFKQHSGDSRAFMTAAIPVATKSLGDLRALKPPTELQSTFNSFLAAQREEIDAVQHTLATHGSDNEAEGATGAKLHVRERLAKTLGITSCE